jgi:microcystin-dependent protein
MRQHTDGDFPFANDFNAVARGALTGDCVLDGCSVTDGGTNDYDVSVASGTITYDGTETSIASTTKTLSSSDANDDRYDLVVAGSDGTVDVVTGTASATPSAPPIPASHVLLAVVLVQAGASGVTDGDIYDARAVMSNIPASAVNNSVPAGLIAIWSGAISNIPAGWVLCDGNNGTPNLQDRFIVGAGSAYAVDATGGASTLALSESELPTHSHDIVIHQHGTSSGEYVESTVDVDEAIDSPASTASVGSGSAHENKPPYHALAYIMKV